MDPKAKNKQRKWVISQVKALCELNITQNKILCHFEPHLQYGCQLQGQAQTEVIQSIDKIQNKDLTILNFKNPWEPIEQVYKESKNFKVKDIVTISTLKFVYDQMNKILPRVFEKKF